MVPFKCFALFYLAGPGGNGLITATAAACWLASTAAANEIKNLALFIGHRCETQMSKMETEL